jgi:chromosome segregation ATPase
MKPRVFVIMIFLAGMLGGCAGVDQDPRSGGILGGISGLSSGSYDNRVKDREARLEQLRATQRELDAEKGQLEEQKSAAYAKVAKDQDRVNTMQSEITQLEKKSKALAAQQGTDKQRVAELDKRVKALKSRMGQQSSDLDALEGSGLGDADIDLRRKQLEKQRDALAREYDLLMKMQMELVQ